MAWRREDLRISATEVLTARPNGSLLVFTTCGNKTNLLASQLDLELITGIEIQKCGVGLTH
jgi:hypothetical protein